MAVLVTGSEGSIGQRLVSLLSSSGIDVVSADYTLKDRQGYEKVDVTRFEEVNRIFRERDIDRVIHLAGEVGRLNGELFPQRMVYVNEIGTLNLIQACIDHSCPLLFFSTSEIYGDLGPEAQMTEALVDSIALHQTNVYALSKYHAERYIHHFFHNYHLKSMIVRPFMIYGPGEYPGKYRSAISNFIYHALLGEPIEVHRGTKRAWTFVDDFIKGVSLLLERKDFSRLEAYNIGSDELYSMEAVAQVVLDATNSKSEVRLGDPPNQFLTPVKVGDFAKIQSLGFHCEINLREGIRRTVEWQRKTLNLG